jgi:aromatic-L-amino-acid decarboxylase
VPLGIVAFRAVTGRGPEADDAFNERVLAEVNAAGPIFLSHSKLFDRYVLRVVIGNIKTTERHVTAAWELIRDTVARLARERRS